jgi:hypothetical protein
MAHEAGHRESSRDIRSRTRGEAWPTERPRRRRPADRSLVWRIESSQIVAERSGLAGKPACPDATCIDERFTIIMAKRNRADRSAGRRRWDLT